MKRATAIFFASLAWTTSAAADEEAYFRGLASDTYDAEGKIARPEKQLTPEMIPGTFTTLGSPYRLWEVRSDTAFGDVRTLTERLEIAHVIPLAKHFEKPKGHENDDRNAFGARLGLVLRATVGLSDHLTDSFFTPQGLQVAVGLRERSVTDNEWIELGVRSLFPYPGPQQADVRMQDLAFESVITSAVADDATWLPIRSFGLQLYVESQARTNLQRFRIGSTEIMRHSVGFLIGARAALFPVAVDTWLGPQNGFIGNAFMEAFFTAVSFGPSMSPGNVQIGVHGEASLSSFWTGDRALPVVLNGFVGWSPLPAFALRAFYGTGGSPNGGVFQPEYGLRLQLFLPNNIVL